MSRTRAELLADDDVVKVARAILPGSYRDIPMIWLVRADRALTALRCPCTPDAPAHEHGKGGYAT